MYAHVSYSPFGSRLAQAEADAASDIYAELIAQRSKSSFRHVSDDVLREIADTLGEHEVDGRSE